MKLGFVPKTSFQEGLKELMQWSSSAEAVDRADKATEELKEKGLLR